MERASESPDSTQRADRTRAEGSEPVLERLRGTFSRYRTENLRGVDAERFRTRIESLIGERDFRSEGYEEDDLESQRDLSVVFTWGHDHDFGDFALQGRMRDRHLQLIANFVTVFPIGLDEFENKDVFDIGCWTGGTALTLAALGARVMAVEEVRKYADMVKFLAGSFGIEDRLEVQPKSVYECNTPGFRDRFDIVHFPGVVYHVSDPVVALRILYNSLREGGTILVESAGIDVSEPYCRFWGNRPVQGDDASGWAWFHPSPSALERMMKEAGFQDIRSVWVEGVDRVYAYGRKRAWRPICKAGLSVQEIP